MLFARTEGSSPPRYVEYTSSEPSELSFATNARSREGSSPNTASSRVSDRNVRTGLSADAIAEALADNLRYLQAKLPEHATRNDWYMALAYTVRDRILERYINTVEAISGASSTAKVVAYFSAEFLTGPHLGNALISLGIWQAA